MQVQQVSQVRATVLLLSMNKVKSFQRTPQEFLAVDISQSPMMWFGGYKESRKSPFIGHYYLTGDTAELHADGSMSFVGRSDDVITTSGYRIGPFDVESALLEHDAVIEAAVIGVPDPDRTEVVKAFVI